MTDHHAPAPRPDGKGHGSGPGIDHEIDVRHIFESGVWLAGITIAAFVVAWLAYLGLAGAMKREDPRPAPLAEAREQRLPPGPQLQTAPERELAAFRRAEEERLAGWGWVDRDHGVAHVPIERAIDELAARGLAPAAGPAE